MIFHDDEFKIVNVRGKPRIPEYTVFRKSWPGHVDVQAIRKFRSGIRYGMKYLTKTKSVSETQTLTLALCWLLRKRSFAISGDLHEVMDISGGHGRIVQTNLMGEEVTINVVWVFTGIFSADKLGITHNEWRKTITDTQILNEILT